jgi:glucosyl-3-phosphoglycerate synthase
MERLETWFARRTFHHSDFEPIERLVERKQATGLTVSVCLPTRNEVATVGEIVRVLREALVDRHRLIDELVVMDAGSTDGTIQAAEAEGAVVLVESDVLADEGRGVGKGEALWKSVYACTGDILCWVDSDIANIHPRFVTGLIGPLLEDASIAYVKAFYERPIHAAGGELLPSGGGRVTELLARPVLNAFWPPLAGIIQPLSGEFAGRRELMERIPFYSGYGVELGLLIDILHEVGMESIAQVDLDRRVHRNQDLAALSRMSFGILQTALAHLVEEGRMDEGTWSSVYAQFVADRDERCLEQHDIGVAKRLPMVKLEAYNQRREQLTGGRR